MLTGAKLVYFKNEMVNRRPLGFIPLDQADVRVCVAFCPFSFSVELFVDSTLKSCVEDVGKEFCFEIVTKDRVFKLSAGSHQEMVDWMASLQPCTLLQEENDLFKEAERTIRVGAQKHFETFEQSAYYPSKYR